MCISATTYLKSKHRDWPSMTSNGTHGMWPMLFLSCHPLQQAKDWLVEMTARVGAMLRGDVAGDALYHRDHCPVHAFARHPTHAVRHPSTCALPRPIVVLHCPIVCHALILEGVRAARITTATKWGHVLAGMHWVYPLQKFAVAFERGLEVHSLAGPCHQIIYKKQTGEWRMTDVRYHLYNMIVH